jgi:hypothetical protein
VALVVYGYRQAVAGLSHEGEAALDGVEGDVLLSLAAWGCAIAPRP